MSSRLQLNKVIEDEIEIGNLEKIFLQNSEELCDSRGELEQPVVA